MLLSLVLWQALRPHGTSVLMSPASCAQQAFVLEEPAVVQLEVRNCTDRALGGLLLRQPDDMPSSNMVLQVLPAARRHGGLWSAIGCHWQGVVGPCRQSVRSPTAVRCQQGLAVARVPDLEPHESVLLMCTLLPMKDGLQRFPELQLCSDADNRVLDSVSGTDVCVQGQG